MTETEKSMSEYVKYVHIDHRYPPVTNPEQGQNGRYSLHLNFSWIISLKFIRVKILSKAMHGIHVKISFYMKTVMYPNRDAVAGFLHNVQRRSDAVSYKISFEALRKFWNNYFLRISSD